MLIPKVIMNKYNPMRRPHNAILRLSHLIPRQYGIVFKGAGITAAFPVTINTAMVSPIARPIPNMAPAVIPDAEYGITTL
jgi:hypothetical protein